MAPKLANHRSASETPPESPPETNNESTSLNKPQAVELLGDEYARRIIEHLATGSTTARSLANKLSASRPTIYRRLNKLKEAGLINSTTKVDPDGHHRDEFHLTTETLEIEIPNILQQSS